MNDRYFIEVETIKLEIVAALLLAGLTAFVLFHAVTSPHGRIPAFILGVILGLGFLILCKSLSDDIRRASDSWWIPKE